MIQKTILKMKKKQILTEKRKEDMIYSLNHIFLLAECIKAEMFVFIDTNLNNPMMHNHIKRIKESTQTLQSFLGVVTKGAEFADDRMLELNRSLRFFSDKDTENLKEFNDKVESDYKELNNIN